MLIAQISDPHIRPQGQLYQDIVDSNRMFADAVAHLNGLDLRPDLVLISGDIVDHGDAAEYAMARALLAELQIPWLVIPGNHDDRAAFRAAFADQPYLPRADGPLHYVVDDRGPVRIVALDITIPGQHHGLVDGPAIAWLDEVLSAAPNRPTILMLHQPPFATGIPYMDPYWCEGGEALAVLIRRFPNVERITCGHVHRFMQLRFGGTALCTAPSTTTTIALQLQPNAKPASYLEPPAFLLHHWNPGTGLITHHCPIGTFPGPYPFA